jgi:hypothetical protein
MENVVLDCWLLDAVDDDFTAIWELSSVLQQRQSCIDKENVLHQLTDRLLSLYKSNFIRFYQGILYNGDELEVNVVINYTFIENEVKDVNNSDINQPITKVYITEAGRVFYLSRCDANMFN